MISIIQAEDEISWGNALSLFHSSIDIYHSASLTKVYADYDSSEGIAFFYQKGENAYFLSGLKKKLAVAYCQEAQKDIYDFQSIYGYVGPLSTTDNKTFIRDARSAIEQACLREDIIAEFTRFHPIFDNSKDIDDKTRVVLDRKTVAISCKQSVQELWDSYPSIQRNRIRKAKKNDLSAVHLDHSIGSIKVFSELYRTRMEHLSADDWYFFDEKYFDGLFDLGADSVQIFAIYLESDVIAAGLFFTHGDIIQYHLGASLQEFSKLGANNLLFHSVSEWGIANEYKFLHLGGGKTPDLDDPLFKFKNKFSEILLDAKIGMKIINQDLYDMCSKSWCKKYNLDAPKNYFLHYRLSPNK